MEKLVFWLVEIFATKLTKRLDKGSKAVAIITKCLFALLAAAPIVWIYINRHEYLGL